VVSAWRHRRPELSRSPHPRPGQPAPSGDTDTVAHNLKSVGYTGREDEYKGRHEDQAGRDRPAPGPGVRGALLVLLVAQAAGCDRSGPPTGLASTPAPDSATGPAAAAKVDEAKAPALAALHTAAPGDLNDLRLDDDGVWFCDPRGAHTLRWDGSLVPSTTPCPAKATDTRGGCDAAFDNQISIHEASPNEVLWVDFGDAGSSEIQLKGHMVSCATDGPSLLVGTYHQVLLYAPAHGGKRVLSDHMGLRVAINRSWIAWQDDKNIEVRRRAP
jgi:hypothetical protein